MLKSNNDSAATGGSSAPGQSRALSVFFSVISAIAGWLLLREVGILDLLPLFRNQDSSALVALCVGALLGLTRARLVLHMITACALCLWLVVAYSPLAGAIARPLVVDVAPVKADAIVVLSSNVQRDDDFTDVALSRLLHGIELEQQQYAPRILLTALRAPSGSYQRAAETLTRNLRIDCKLETVGTVVDTHDEAVGVAHLAKERGWKRIILVTSPTHSKRSRLVFQKALGAGIEVVSSPSRENEFDLEHLPTPADRLRAFAAALHEIVGMRVYRQRGWI